MEQLQLLLRDSKKQVSLEVIISQPTFKDALKLCKAVSGFNDQQLCNELNIDAAQWSRIWSNTAHFPDNKLIPFMILCGNIVPLIWLVHKLGYSLRPLKTELETENEQLKDRVLELENKLKIIEEWENKKSSK